MKRFFTAVEGGRERPESSEIKGDFQIKVSTLRMTEDWEKERKDPWNKKN